MATSRKAKLALAAVIVIASIAGFFFAFLHPHDRPTSRQQLLEFIPSDATAVVYLDFEDLKNSPFLTSLYAWAAKPAEDSEYSQFVRDSGFSYERDLERVMIAVSHRSSAAEVFVVADGKFDRTKIASYLERNAKAAQQGKWKTYLLNATMADKPMSIAFLSDNRVAMSNSENFSAQIAATSAAANRAEWNSRFERLAGTPAFAVIRQDSSVQEAIGSVAPGGFSSPQLASLLGQLQWISIAGKPEGDQLRLVAEGESLSDQVSSQLREVLQGVLLLAQSGLNDPKLRQRMAPEARETYVNLLRGTEIQKLDRGDWKSVRVVLAITPQFLELARRTSLAPQSTEEAKPAQKTAKPEKLKPQARK